MRLIDADAAADKIMRETENLADNLNMIGIALMIGIAKMLQDENDFPTIETEVRHGHWENIPGMNNTVFCSECLAAANKELAMKYKGCPFCLAQMGGGADNG